MLRPSLLLLCGTLFVFAQNPEAGRIERQGATATLFVDSPRPLDSAAITLVQAYGLRVSVEDPPYLYAKDIKDITAEVARVPHPDRRLLVPQGGKLRVSFPIRPDHSPKDVRALLQKVVTQANAQFPFAYRLDNDHDLFIFVPTRSRDVQGRSIVITPLLDRRVDIPLGTRTIAATANLMTAALAAQVGALVDCCRSGIGGVPWGIQPVTLAAQNEPARSVLRRLIAADLQGRPDRSYWFQRCDPLPSAWCVINIDWIAPPLPWGTPTTPFLILPSPKPSGRHPAPAPLPPDPQP